MTETAELTPVLVWVNEKELSHARSDAANARQKAERLLNALIPFNVEIPTDSTGLWELAHGAREYVLSRIKKELESELSVGSRKINADKYLETLDMPSFFELEKAARELSDSRDAGSYVSYLEITVRTEKVEAELPEGFDDILRERYSHYAKTEKQIRVIEGIQKFYDAYEEFESDILKITDTRQRNNFRENTLILEILKKKDLYGRLTRY